PGREDVRKQGAHRESGEDEHEANDRRDQRIVLVVEAIAKRIGRVLKLEESATREIEVSAARLLHDSGQRTGEDRLRDTLDRYPERDRDTGRGCLGADPDRKSTPLNSSH